MTAMHPLEKTIREAERFILIGDSSEDRFPVYYLKDKPTACAAHTLMVKASGSYRRPPQTDSDAKRRELW